ncbi:NERD domain-containing protein [Nocardia sp. NPDC004068]|uniref:nuclease-related domain-containing protein n=1 Tax=Nocardia sp. NPDC004068 TaxID=3364303 RepID=UPI0036BFFD63
MVLDWLRGWNGTYKIVGVAVSGCYVPDRRGGTRADETDLVVITPEACVVVEVKGITAPVGGILDCPPGGPWTLEGFDGSPLHVRAGDQNPLDQVSGAMYGLKNLTKRLGLETFVSGLVLIMTQPGQEITLRKEQSRTGMDVLVADPAELRAWFRRAARRKSVRGAEQTHALLEALNFGRSLSIADLVAEGFGSESPAPQQDWPLQPPHPTDQSPPITRLPTGEPSPQIPPSATANPDPEPSAHRLTNPPGLKSTPTPGPSPRVTTPTDNPARRLTTPPGLRSSPPPEPPPPTTPPARSPARRRVPGLRAVVAVVLLAVVAVVFWLVVHGRVGVGPGGAGTTTPVTPSVVEQSPQPPQAPPPPRPTACYPLQPNC